MERAQHVVLFKFPEELSEEDERYMFSIVGTWPSSIQGMTGLRLGKDVGGRNLGFSWLLLTEFESEKAHRAYYEAPEHVEFSNWVGSKGAEVLRVDYPLDSQTHLL